MHNAGDKAVLDQHVKSLFGHKAVLTVLLKHCVPEFKDLSESYIMEHCFVGEPIVSRVPVHRDAAQAPDVPEFPASASDSSTSDTTEQANDLQPDEPLDGNERVWMLNSEDRTQNEGTTIYDIVFQARVPSSGSIIGLIINVEIQNDSRLAYDVVTRGIYYCCRLISAQRDRIFKKQE